MIKFVKLLALTAVLTTLPSLGCKGSKLNPSDGPPGNMATSETAVEQVDEEESKHGDASQNAKVAMRHIKVKVGAATLKDPTAKPPSYIRTQLADKLKADKLYDFNGIPMTGEVLYDFSRTNHEGKKFITLALIGNFRLKKKEHEEELFANMVVEHEVGSEKEEEDKSATDAFFNRTLNAFNEQVSEGVRVLLVDDDKIDALLIDESLLPESRMALLRHISKHFDKARIPSIRLLLEEKNLSLAVAAATLLASAHDTESAEKILSLAKAFEKTHPELLIPLLRTIFQVGGEEGKEYLQTLATTSSSDQVKKEAEKLLKLMNHEK